MQQPHKRRCVRISSLTPISADIGAPRLWPTVPDEVRVERDFQRGDLCVYLPAAWSRTGVRFRLQLPEAGPHLGARRWVRLQLPPGFSDGDVISIRGHGFAGSLCGDWPGECLLTVHTVAIGEPRRRPATGLSVG